jgi:serine/threonine protein kinase
MNMQELIAMKFGPYQIQSHLTKGGMANIYLAHNVETENEPLVAIKLVHTSTGDNCERFRRETKAHSTLHHNHILPVLAHGEHNSWCYLITPYIEGGTLTRRLDHGPLSLQEATETFSQIAGALHHIHEQGMVHRDIKSSNVLMRGKHHAYLADFGLVKHVGLDSSLTVSGYLMGTPEYMAPELSEEEASPCSDIYALGILLYQMLIGHVPFKAISPIQICLKHIQEKPVNPSVLNPAIPSEVAQVVLHALAKNPDERYQTVQDFNIAYQQALVQANARQLKRADAATYLLSTTIRVPRIKIGAQPPPDAAQPPKATPPRQRKHTPDFVRLVVALALLILSLLSTSGHSAQQISPAQLSTRAIFQIAHDQASPTPLPTPTPQQMGESQNGNGTSDNVSTQSHENSNNNSANSKGKGQDKQQDNKKKSE